VEIGVRRHRVSHPLGFAAVVLIASAALARGEQPGAEVLQRWGCLGCHSVAGAGGKVAPPLDDVVQRRGEEWVRKKIRNPRGTNPYTIMPTLALKPKEIDEVIDYLTHEGDGHGEQ
jgi:cytochrome c2